jgi:hypothetical protein
MLGRDGVGQRAKSEDTCGEDPCTVCKLFCFLLDCHAAVEGCVTSTSSTAAWQFRRRRQNNLDTD